MRRPARFRPLCACTPHCSLHVPTVFVYILSSYNMLSLKWLRRFPFEKYARVFRRCDNAREDLLVHCNYAICLPSHFISKNRCCHQDAITLCCWNCGATIQNQEQSICKTCTTDYFKFLNLKRDFNIDLNSLKVFHFLTHIICM